MAGVRTRDGEEVAADLVVDAMDRRSKLPDWLAAVGARRPVDEAEESGFIYYTRFFRPPSGAVPPFRSMFATHFHSFTLLILPGDSQTWSVTVFIFTGDAQLKALHESKYWTTLVAACPLHAHWLEVEPISDVFAMGGVTDRYRRFVVDGAPVATGIVSVGDAGACTDPVRGRGISTGLMHAIGTAKVVGQHLDEPLRLALAHDEMTEGELTPWYQDTAAFDRQRTAQIAAAMEGRRLPPPTNPVDALPVAMLHDADLFRVFVEVCSLLAHPREVMARPGIAERIMATAGAHEAMEPPGPTRAELLRMLA